MKVLRTFLLNTELHRLATRCLQAGFVYSVGVIFWSASGAVFCFMSMVCLPYIFTKSKEILGVKAEKSRFFLGKGRQRCKTVA